MGTVHPMLNGEERKGKEKAHFAITLAEIENGGIRIESDIPIEWLKRRMCYCEYSAEPKSATTSLRAETSGHGVLIRGSVSAQIETLCGSCLKDITINIYTKISSYLMPLSEATNVIEETELTPEDLDREYFNGDTIVLDEIIGDAIMLEMPMNPKCVGTCAEHSSFNQKDEGSDIDPRLAPLLGIRINKEK